MSLNSIIQALFKLCIRTDTVTSTVNGWLLKQFKDRIVALFDEDTMVVVLIDLTIAAFAVVLLLTIVVVI